MTNELALLPNETELNQIQKLSAVLTQSGFLPSSIKTWQQAAAIMIKGRELGVPPMQAFAQISVINGKPALGAELMLSRIYARYPQAHIQIIKREADGCHIRARRSDKLSYADFKFELEDAKRAGLLGKDSWQKYPKSMYYWRAVGDMARSLWPECLAGCSHTPEELGADVNEDGEIIIADASSKATYVDIPKETSEMAMHMHDPEPTSPVDSEPKKSTGFDRNNETHRQTLELILTNNKIDQMLWPEIFEKLQGKPSTMINTLIKSYRASLHKTNPATKQTPEKCNA
jgi:hypothetical protein